MADPGGHSGTMLPLVTCFRTESMEVSNDPRMMAKNILLKRMGAFHVIAVSAVLLGNLSLKEMSDLQKDEITGEVQYLAFFALGMTFLMNFCTVVIIIQQLFYITRLSTMSANGFEVAQTYYLNHNVITMRHCATWMFFICIPIFMLAVAGVVFVKFGKRYEMSLPVVVFLVLSSLGLFIVNRRHRYLFQAKYEMAMSHHSPLVEHLTGTEIRTNDRYEIG
mmetsp:Transcript_1863/g.4277  ORF Transcript_1863/g.4277 Transcript_1863/m.4277 type:complete len:221 (-) Transcript_1863:109-771(-)